MKLLKSLFLVAILAIVGNLIAQDEVGYIKYAFTDIQSDNPSIQQQVAMYKNGYMELYIGKSKVLSITNMAGLSVTKNLVNKETGETTLYMDMMGRKIKIHLTKEQQEELQSEKMNTEVDVKKVKGATKEILGYTANKVLFKLTSDKFISTTEIWSTDELNADTEIFMNMIQLGNSDVKIEGVPLQYTINLNGMMKITYTASVVKMVNETDYSVMKIDDTGYTEKSFDEIKSMLGG